ncbi:L,D-transpeptidase family protein [Hymenobacter sp. BRD128]|uniref:L,D-transpeptidase family protein n=1 Tax=Hymenobacter sp. BRD128 TaxID=2675878 RepID=UPI0015650A1C|nr:L,D-transpeptidase family protein [Hymenobacter sp. BRD128]QKG55263.1 L,D-transpeptidase family protein [Hymenobacter sp. BRD128]
MCACLLLASPGCGPTPATHVAAAGLPAPSPKSPPLAVPVAPLIRALLDTLATSRAHPRLQAEAEVRAFYGPASAPAWTLPADSADISPNATVALALLGRAAEYGLRPADYGHARLRALRDSLAQPASLALPARRARQQAQLEVYLSDAVLTFRRDLDRGRLRAYTPSGRERTALAAPPAALRAALASRTVPAAMLAGQPTNREYRQLQQALARWLAWPFVPDSARQHQARYELAALNLERWRWEMVTQSADYLLINIPAYELHVVARDSVLRRYRVVVGKPTTPTPTLSSAIRYFTLAPDWHVPHSIAVREMLPRLQKDPGYLARHNYALYDERGELLDPAHINWAHVTARQFPYTIRQATCCDNALGNIVFRFNNPYSVYLHDTPQRQLFAQPMRALSHGCIRLEHPLALAAYLLRRAGQPVNLPSDDACARQPSPRDVRLTQPLALYVRYATCTAENGHLRFFADVYQRDEAVRQALFGPLALASQ